MVSVADWEMRSNRNSYTFFRLLLFSVADWEMRSNRNHPKFPWARRSKISLSTNIIGSVVRYGLPYPFGFLPPMRRLPRVTDRTFPSVCTSLS